MTNDNMQDYKLEIAFPTDDTMFAKGVAWEMFRQKLKNTKEGFGEYVLEDIGKWLSDMVKHYDREVKISSSEWPGWSFIKVGPKIN